MEKYPDPKQFGLPPRTVLREESGGYAVLVKKRKSRIIMKDGEKIKEIRDRLVQSGGYSGLILETNAPVCSKTRKMLAESGIPVRELQT